MQVGKEAAICLGFVIAFFIAAFLSFRSSSSQAFLPFYALQRHIEGHGALLATINFCDLVQFFQILIKMLAMWCRFVNHLKR